MYAVGIPLLPIIGAVSEIETARIDILNRIISLYPIIDDTLLLLWYRMSPYAVEFLRHVLGRQVYDPQILSQV